MDFSDLLHISPPLKGSGCLAVRNVACWPITTFRCAAEFGRYQGNNGLWPAERPVDLWVHGLVKCPAEELPPSDRRAYAVVRC